jgi:hypothetical protein
MIVTPPDVDPHEIESKSAIAFLPVKVKAFLKYCDKTVARWNHSTSRVGNLFSGFSSLKALASKDIVGYCNKGLSWIYFTLKWALCAVILQEG